ncbi:alpha/beta hydrolase fold domain-containing protein [Streptomyces sp. NPDC102437]|uniref:alpha/beta hydrolase fold domain-containing protein n=1 Tax=Streptomyces sp. NPDC102437 TaxID=3366175 RepID=UPI0037FB991F
MSGNVKTSRQHRAVVQAARLVRYNRLWASSLLARLATRRAARAARRGAEAVTVTGDSAGGDLALAAVQHLVHRGETPPDRLVLISPWLDVTLDDPASLEMDDPLLSVAGSRACERLWAGDLNPADPMASPMFGPLTALPPITVYAGTLDVLYPDAARLAERARAEGAAVDIVVREGLVHTWSLFTFLPEPRAVWPQLHPALIGDTA